MPHKMTDNVFDLDMDTKIYKVFPLVYFITYAANVA
jgi:hypothetical protein